MKKLLAILLTLCMVITMIPLSVSADSAEPTAKFTSISTSLGGNIAMNFYAELSEELVRDPRAYIRFSFAGRTVSFPLNQGILSRENVYRYSCPITSKNMTDEITAQIYNASGPVGEAKTMSVDTYCNWVIENTKDEKTVNLMKAMLNYSASAQLLFNYRTNDLANAALAPEDKVLGAVDASAYAHSRTGEDWDIQPVSYTLLLDSETTIRCYFKASPSWVSQSTFTVDGERAYPVYKDGKYYIEKTNIAAHRLDDMHVFTCNGITITYGGLSYVNQVMTYYTEGTTFDMASALYAYSKAAEEYISGTASDNTTLSLDKTELTLRIGGTEIYKLIPIYNGSGTLSWSSSDRTIAHVTSVGNVVAINKGTAVITVTDGTLSASCKVIVEGPGEFTMHTQDEEIVVIGKPYQLDFTYDGDLSDLTFESYDPEILTVDNNGLVTGISEGYGGVAVYYGTEWLASVYLKVQEKELGPADRMILSGNDGSWEVGCVGNSLTFSVWVKTVNDYNIYSTATSSNPNVATVSTTNKYGSDTRVTVSYVGAGSTTITLTSEDGMVSTSFTINVKEYTPQEVNSPESFVAAVNYVASMNDCEIYTTDGAYTVLWLTDAQLTWRQALASGQQIAQTAFWAGADGAFGGCSYQGIDPNNGEHMFYLYAF